MVNPIVAVWATDPDVAVTVIVAVVGSGGFVLPPPPPPPHEAIKMTPAETKITVQQTMARRFLHKSSEPAIASVAPGRKG
jgi:hypothetical protein